ncbi:SDR family NAD(P)-dependent oxidoreductase [Schlesneria sp.]|uniref:SDR family NAD(P)-dependent oxidoreductase n=1 Tax=Schlesneria sp. TaxID=2762018 RepID=UPI002EEE7128
MINLTGKFALVTGAGRGIGKGCALQLARCGADIILNDRPGSPDLAATAEEIRALGRTCHAMDADVFSRAGCEALVEKAIKTAGRIDIFVSNPAYSRRGKFLEYSPDEFERTINGTLISGFHMSQLVARHMVAQRIRGKMVFISSVQAEMPFALCAPYGAAKAGLNHLTRTISVELAPHRINVNCIEPGWIDTPGEHVTFSDETMEEEGARLPWGRLGLPEDIGNAAAFLVSEQADYVTGVVFPVDGGFRFKDCQAESIVAPAEPKL